MKNRCCGVLQISTMHLLSAIVLIDLFAIHVAAESTAVVNTTSGPVQGEIVATFNSLKYAAFVGMRYGKAPVGYLRFKPPVIPDPWTEILNATVEGDDCMQYNSRKGYIKGSEDCLFINVHTPVVDLAERPTNLKSVLLRIYGGAFLTGTSSVEIERPDYFIEKDIVFVSLNYRSGIFGYLALGLANATGNAGLKDLVLGLKWVRANIENFGGNPNNVTILGASSGAAIVHYLVLSDATAGLFHGAISISGSALASWAFQGPAKALSQAGRLADLMGITWTDKEALLQAFYDASAVEIVNATAQIDTAFGPFRPTMEDESIATDAFLTKCSIDKYISGNFNKVPHLLGYTDQETVVIARDISKIEGMIKQSIVTAEASHFAVPPSVISTKNRVESSTDFFENLNYTLLRKFINDTSNLLYIIPVDQTQQILASNNNDNPVYYYHLSYFVPGTHHVVPENPLPGSGHGDEIPFLFYVEKANYIDIPNAQRTVTRMTTMWSNFVKYGNPTPHWVDDSSLNFTWPDSGPSALSLKIGCELTIEPSPISMTGKYFENLIWPHLRDTIGCE